jgi:hypothetical protein
MSETESAAAAAAEEERKPRRLRGHKKGAVTCCVASSARPGVVASAGEVRVAFYSSEKIVPWNRRPDREFVRAPWSMGVLELPIVAGYAVFC